MRIISGKNRSRIIKMVGIDTTRETTDKVRGAIFNLINAYPLEDKRCLDLFSGSGAMGLEALSRGCKEAYFNDLNRKAYETTLDNIKTLNYGNNTFTTNLDYRQALKKYHLPFDFIFLDPPYIMDCCNEIINYVIGSNLLTKDGIIICETNKDYQIEINDIIDVYKERVYGIRKITIVKRR